MDIAGAVAVVTGAGGGRGEPVTMDVTDPAGRDAAVARLICYDTLTGRVLVLDRGQPGYLLPDEH